MKAKHRQSKEQLNASKTWFFYLCDAVALGLRMRTPKTNTSFDGDLEETETGPHAFLIVVKPERFTEENAKIVQLIERIFGEEPRDYTMAVFTHGDQLEQDIKTIIRSNSALRTLVRNCVGRYFVIDNKKQDSAQVMQLLNKIDEMVSDDCGEYYTNDMLQETERAIEEEKQRILNKNEEQRKRKMEALVESVSLNTKNKVQEKQLEKMKKEFHEIQARIQAEKNYFIRYHILKLFVDCVTFLFSK